MSIHEPFELEYWFINVFSGSVDIFLLVSILLITWACSIFKMQMSSFLVLLVVYAALIATTTSNILLVLLILTIAPILFWITRRVVD